MSFEHILFDLNAGIAKLTLNRPKSLNSFNEAMHLEVRTALDEVEASDECRVLLITGAGRGFCAGQDLSDRHVKPGDEAPDLGYTLDNFYNPLVRRLKALEMPVICAVNGVAAGAGANLALAADIVLAARSAKFIQAFCKLGLIPDSGGTWALPRLLGPARAAGLALLGDALSAQQAEEWGLIWRCVDDDELPGAAESLCTHFASQPTRGLALIKQALAASWGHTLDEQLDLEKELQRTAGRSVDYKEGVSAFMEKRPATFVGR
jgi:2-(1,2-epoxy-1,2-dihydrophenyl)acetyl-CoA isomerase